MYLTQLSLTNFRNYTRLSLDLDRHTTILYGANAQGKTNLLEAIYFLAVAKSPYATSDAQLVNWLAEQDDLPYARITADLARGGEHIRIEIVLTQSTNGQPGYRKHIRINGVPKKVMDLIGHTNVVLFVPQDIGLIDGPPAMRRRYLDSTLCQMDGHYCRALAQYNRVLEQRNHLLRTLRERGGARDQLDFWDQRLAHSGSQIISRRQQAIVELETLAQSVHLDLSGGRERLRLRYVPSFDPRPLPGNGRQMTMNLDLPPPISTPQDAETVHQAFLNRLQASHQEEIQKCMTLLGPHRDDLRFFDGQVDLHTYGSRGQQRTAVLALKLAEVALMAQTTGEQPILLLDDVMSELDPDRRHYLCTQLALVEQALITSTDLDALSPDIPSQATLYHVSQGYLSPVTLPTQGGEQGELHSPSSDLPPSVEKVL